MRARGGPGCGGRDPSGWPGTWGGLRRHDRCFGPTLAASGRPCRRPGGHYRPCRPSGLCPRPQRLSQPGRSTPGPVCRGRLPPVMVSLGALGRGQPVGATAGGRLLRARVAGCSRPGPASRATPASRIPPVLVAGRSRPGPACLRPAPSCGGRRRARTGAAAACRGPARACPARSPGAAPSARAWTSSVAQRRGLHRARRHRQPAGVRGELAQQAVPRAAADQVDDVDGPPGQLLGLDDRPPVGQRQAVQDAAGGLGRAVRGRLARRPGRPRRSGTACRPAAGTPGRRCRSPSAAAAQAAACGQQVTELDARPAARQARSDSCSSHRPVTLRRYRIRAVQAGLVGEVRPAAGLGQHRRSSSSRPATRCRWRCRRSRGPARARRPRPTRCRASRPRSPAVRARQAGALAGAGQHRSPTTSPG